MFKKYERKSNANLLVFSAGKSIGMTNDTFDRSGGRSVFYVTVGQMKHTRIIIKQFEPEDKVITAQDFVYIMQLDPSQIGMFADSFTSN